MVSEPELVWHAGCNSCSAIVDVVRARVLPCADGSIVVIGGKVVRLKAGDSS